MNDTINKIVVIFLCLLTIDSFSQSNTFSPYSRFGLGTFSNNFSSYYQSMGGASTASLNSVYVNPSNPASYSLIQPKKFIFHTSLKNNTTFLESSSKNEVYNNAKLSSLIFGFPINNKIGFIFDEQTKDKINLNDVVKNYDLINENAKINHDKWQEDKKKIIPLLERDTHNVKQAHFFLLFLLDDIKFFLKKLFKFNFNN